MISTLKTLEAVEVEIPTMNINIALLLAIKKYNEGILKLDGIYYLLKQKQRMIQNYQMIFKEAVRGNINYNANSDHPSERGITTIFTIKKDDDNNTANDTYTPLTLFQKACNGLGRNTALKMLEETLQRSSRSINTIRALMYAATKNSNHEQGTVVHLDCSYILLRRQPDVLLNLLSSSSSSSSGVSNDSSNSSSNCCGNAIIDDKDDYCRQQQSNKRMITTG